MFIVVNGFLMPFQRKAFFIRIYEILLYSLFHPAMKLGMNKMYQNIY
jgi:hypothetical protein